MAQLILALSTITMFYQMYQVVVSASPWYISIIAFVAWIALPFFIFNIVRYFAYLSAQLKILRGDVPDDETVDIYEFAKGEALKIVELSGFITMVAYLLTYSY